VSKTINDLLKNIQPFDDDAQIWFGKHQGTKFSEVPTSYLNWWVGSEGTTKTLKLIKYLLINEGSLEGEIQDEEIPF